MIPDLGAFRKEVFLVFLSRSAATLFLFPLVRVAGNPLLSSLSNTAAPPEQFVKSTLLFFFFLRKVSMGDFSFFLSWGMFSGIPPLLGTSPFLSFFPLFAANGNGVSDPSQMIHLIIEWRPCNMAAILCLILHGSSSLSPPSDADFSFPLHEGHSFAQ